MSQVTRMFSRKISSPGVDILTGQIACWMGALLVMCLGIRKLTLLGLNETQLLFGILLVMILTMQMVMLGMILPFVEAFWQKKKKNSEKSAL